MDWFDSDEQDIYAAIIEFRQQRSYLTGGSKRRATGYFTSELAKLLVEGLAFGEFSAAMLQRISHAAWVDGNKHEDIVELARIGTSGANESNCRRDLLRIIARRNVVIFEATSENTPF